MRRRPGLSPGRRPIWRSRAHLTRGDLASTELTDVFDRSRTLLQGEMSDFRLYPGLKDPAGFAAGLLVGIGLGVAAFKSKILARILAPMLDSMRAIPAIAIIPFFLLWFGFSEVGRILLVVTGIAFNIAIATYQVLKEIPEKHEILFKSFNIAPSALTRDYIVPRVLETLLPTVRFSLATAMGVVIASELLGSQIGLGYLMQTARNTFSMHVIFLCTILLGLLNAIVDMVVTRSWTRAVYWR